VICYKRRYVGRECRLDPDAFYGVLRFFHASVTVEVHLSRALSNQLLSQLVRVPKWGYLGVGDLRSAFGPNPEEKRISALTGSDKIQLLTSEEAPGHSNEQIFVVPVGRVVFTENIVPGRGAPERNMGLFPSLQSPALVRKSEINRISLGCGTINPF
jgi:hypothetical protein